MAEFEAAVAGEGDAMRLAETKRSLRYWRTPLATAQLMPPPPEDEVGFGSRVRFVLKGAARTIDIVGDDDADPAGGRIAFSAPLARALIGAGQGDYVEFGDEEDAIEVIDVGRITE